MADKTVSVRLQAQISGYLANMAQASAATRQLGKNVTGTGRIADRDLARLSRSALLLGGGIAAGLGLSAKAAIDWESAWAGVTKTVDGTQTQMASLEAGLRQMATELPATHSEIAAVAEAAGQLGIAVPNIEGFTRTMIDLGETTNLSSDQAATSLARFMNVMGTSQNEVSNLGSTIVELGNNSATTEAEIVEMAMRIAGAGKQIGFTEADVLGFAAALSSVGIEAEAGGTAISRVMIEIQKAVQRGGDELEVFAETAGMTTTEFSAAFRDDAAGAISTFIQGLGDVTDSGGDVNAVLEDLHLDGIRVGDTLRRVASNSDGLTESLSMAAEAFAENSALGAEAAERYDTLASKLEVTRNQFVDLGIQIGEYVVPAISGVVDVTSDMLAGFSALPDPLKKAAVGFGGVSSAGLLTLGAVTNLAPKVRDAKAALEGMGTAGQFVGSNMGKIAGIAAGVTVAVGLGVLAYGEATKASREYAADVKELVGVLEPVAQGQTKLNDALDEYLELQARDMGGDQLEVMRAFGVKMGDVRRAIVEGKDALDPFRDSLQRMGIELDGVDLGKLNDTEGLHSIQALADELGVSAGELRTFIGEIENWDNAQQDAARSTLEALVANEQLTQKQQEQLGVTAALAGENDNFVGVLEAVNKALYGTGDAAEAGADGAALLDDGLDGLGDAAQSTSDLVNTLNTALGELIGIHIAASDAAISGEKAFVDLGEAIKENGVTTDIHTEQGRLNASAINDTAKAALDHAEAVARETGKVDDAADILTIYRQRLLDTMIQSGWTREAAENYIKTLGLTPENIATAIQLDGVQAAESVLAWITRTRSSTIRVGVERVQIAGGRAVGLAQGGITDYSFAGSGITPAHITAGETIKYGEPETGGEAFIPRHGEKNQVLGVLDKAAGWHDHHIVPNNQNDGAGGGQMWNGHPQGGGGGVPSPATVVVDFSGAPHELKRWLRQTVRTEGGGNVQVTFGQGAT